MMPRSASSTICRIVLACARAARREPSVTCSCASFRASIAQSTHACPDQSGPRAKGPGHAHHAEQHQVRKGPADLKPRRPRRLRESGGHQKRGARDAPHDGKKSVITRTKVMLWGSLTHASCASSEVEASRCVTLATSPTTSPRGYPPPTPLVSAHSPFDAETPSVCWTSMLSEVVPPDTVPWRFDLER